MLSYQNSLVIFVGSLTHAVLLIGLCRWKRVKIPDEAGMSGQFIDWLMHSVSGLAIALGYF